MQGKGSNPLKVLIKENKVIYQMYNQLNSGWCHTFIIFHLYVYIYIFFYLAKCGKCMPGNYYTSHIHTERTFRLHIYKWGYLHAKLL